MGSTLNPLCQTHKHGVTQDIGYPLVKIMKGAFDSRGNDARESLRS